MCSWFMPILFLVSVEVTIARPVWMKNNRFCVYLITDFHMHQTSGKRQSDLRDAYICLNWSEKRTCIETVGICSHRVVGGNVGHKILGFQAQPLVSINIKD